VTVLTVVRTVKMRIGVAITDVTESGGNAPNPPRVFHRGGGAVLESCVGSIEKKC
jgi:hypothetical protein